MESKQNDNVPFRSTASPANAKVLNNHPDAACSSQVNCSLNEITLMSESLLAKTPVKEVIDGIGSNGEADVGDKAHNWISLESVQVDADTNSIQNAWMLSLGGDNDNDDENHELMSTNKAHDERSISKNHHDSFGYVASSIPHLLGASNHNQDLNVDLLENHYQQFQHVHDGHHHNQQHEREELELDEHQEFEREVEKHAAKGSHHQHQHIHPHNQHGHSHSSHSGHSNPHHHRNNHNHHYRHRDESFENVKRAPSDIFSELVCSDASCRNESCLSDFSAYSNSRALSQGLCFQQAIMMMKSPRHHSNKSVQYYSPGGYGDFGDSTEETRLPSDTTNQSGAQRDSETSVSSTTSVSSAKSHIYQNSSAPVSTFEQKLMGKNSANPCFSSNNNNNLPIDEYSKPPGITHQQQLMFNRIGKASFRNQEPMVDSEFNDGSLCGGAYNPMHHHHHHQAATHDSNIAQTRYINDYALPNMVSSQPVCARINNNMNNIHISNINGNISHNANALRRGGQPNNTTPRFNNSRKTNFNSNNVNNNNNSSISSNANSTSTSTSPQMFNQAQRAYDIPCTRESNQLTLPFLSRKQIYNEQVGVQSASAVPQVYKNYPHQHSLIQHVQHASCFNHHQHNLHLHQFQQPIANFSAHPENRECEFSYRRYNMSATQPNNSNNSINNNNNNTSNNNNSTRESGYILHPQCLDHDAVFNRMQEGMNNAPSFQGGNSPMSITVNRLLAAYSSNDAHVLNSPSPSQKAKATNCAPFKSRHRNTPPQAANGRTKAMYQGVQVPNENEKSGLRRHTHRRNGFCSLTFSQQKQIVPR